MLNILYEDEECIVVEKPAGMESQVSRGFAPDMVSEIKKHLIKTNVNKLSTRKSEPYVGVIHRLDKPVGGIMVYAKTQKAAAILSKQVQTGQMKKKYKAVICGKPVDNVGNYVDYLLKDEKTNISKIVDKGITGAKRAELNYRVEKLVDIISGKEQEVQLYLVEIELLTGRHHQIRVQMSGHGTPLWGDQKYNSAFSDKENRHCNVALYSCFLSFKHPSTGKVMEFALKPHFDYGVMKRK